jgi:hypothetical protein
MSNQNAFNEAVRLIRLGHKTSVEIVSELDDMLGLDKPAWQIVAEARAYLTELQTKAFEASIDAFKRGESQLNVESKLRELGFHSHDAEVVAGRAKAKADAELAEESFDALSGAELKAVGESPKEKQ